MASVHGPCRASVLSLSCEGIGPGIIERHVAAVTRGARPLSGRDCAWRSVRLQLRRWLAIIDAGKIVAAGTPSSLKAGDRGHLRLQLMMTLGLTPAPGLTGRPAPNVSLCGRHYRVQHGPSPSQIQLRRRYPVWLSSDMSEDDRRRPAPGPNPRAAPIKAPCGRLRRKMHRQLQICQSVSLSRCHRSLMPGDTQ